jgi:hypothetical protein
LTAAQIVTGRGDPFGSGFPGALKSAFHINCSVRFERAAVSILTMKRLVRVARWLLIAFGLVVVALFAVHLALRPNPELAASEQYHVLSAYINPNLTGESHDLGSRDGLVVIDGRTTFSEPMVNSSKFKQSMSLLARTGRAKATIPQLRRSLVFEFWAANLRDNTFERKFQLAARYELATKQEMNLYPFEAFFARFPSSY